MKVQLRQVGIIVIVFLAGMAIGATGLSRVRHLDARDWLVAASYQGGSADENCYLGSSEQRAYVMRRSAYSTFGTDVIYWTEVANLPEPLATQLKAEYFDGRKWRQNPSRFASFRGR